MAATPPPYAPDTVNQTVDYGGTTWKGQPGGGWTAQNATGGGFEDIIKKTIALQQEANKPAVESLQASIPENSAKYAQGREQVEAQRKPLEDRYANLLSEIKGNQTTSENRQTVSTRNELGRRGLVGGGLYDQTLTDAVNPITEQYTRMSKDTGISKEQDIQALNNILANLTTSEVESSRAVQNAIAQLQAGAAQSGIQQGIGQYQFNTQQELQNAQLEEQKKQNEIANALAKAQATPTSNYATLSEGQTLFDLTNLQSVFSAPKTYKSSGGGSGGW